MDDKELTKLEVLRHYYDMALSVCDSLDFAIRQRDLSYAIAEYLIEPLQKYEITEMSKLTKEEVGKKKMAKAVKKVVNERMNNGMDLR